MNSVKTFQTAPRILMGPGSLNQIADEVKRLNGERVMIVTDQKPCQDRYRGSCRRAFERGGDFGKAFR